MQDYDFAHNQIYPNLITFSQNFTLILPTSNQFYPTKSLMGDAAASPAPTAFIDMHQM